MTSPRCPSDTTNGSSDSTTGLREPRLCRHAFDIRGNRVGSVALDDFIGDGSQRRATPAHRDAQFARVDQIVIVLGVADADGVVQRGAELEERTAQADRLGHAGRQNHEPSTVERQDVRLFERAHGFEDRNRFRRVGFNHAFAAHESQPAPRQLVDKELRRGMADLHMAPGRGKFDYGAVLRHDRVEHAELGVVAQVDQAPAGHEHHTDAATPGTAERIDDSP